MDTIGARQAGGTHGLSEALEAVTSSPAGRASGMPEQAAPRPRGARPIGSDEAAPACVRAGASRGMQDGLQAVGAGVAEVSASHAPLSYATWSALQRFAGHTTMGHNDWVGKIAAVRDDAAVEADLTLEFAVKQLSLNEPSRQPGHTTVFAVVSLGRSDVARLSAARDSAVANAAAPGLIINHFLSASKKSMRAVRFGVSGAANWPPPSVAKTAFCQIHRSQRDAGADIGAILPARSGEVLFPPGAHFSIARIEGSLVDETAFSMVLYPEPLTRAQQQERLGVTSVRPSAGTLRSVSERYRTPAAALSELSDLRYLAACEPRWAVDRLLCCDEHGWHSGNWLAALIEARKAPEDEHVVALAGMYCELLAALVHRRDMSAAQAIELVANGRILLSSASLANLIADHWWSASADELAALCGECIATDPASRRQWIDCLSFIRLDPPTPDRSWRLADFYDRIECAMAARAADYRATRALFELDLIAPARSLHAVARALPASLDEAVPSAGRVDSARGDLCSLRDAFDARCARTFLDCEREALRDALELIAEARQWHQCARLRAAREAHRAAVAHVLRDEARQQALVEAPQPSVAVTPSAGLVQLLAAAEVLPLNDVAWYAALHARRGVHAPNAAQIAESGPPRIYWRAQGARSECATGTLPDEPAIPLQSSRRQWRATRDAYIAAWLAHCRSAAGAGCLGTCNPHQAEPFDATRVARFFVAPLRECLEDIRDFELQFGCA